MIYTEDRDYKVKFFTDTKTGRSKVLEFIDKLKTKEKAKILKYIEFLRTNKGRLKE